MIRKINITLIVSFALLYCLDYFKIFSAQNVFGLGVLLIGFLKVGLLLFFVIGNRTGKKGDSLFVIKKSLIAMGNFYHLFLTLFLLLFLYFGINELLRIEDIDLVFNPKTPNSLAPNPYFLIGLGIFNFADSLQVSLKPGFLFKYADNKLEVYESEKLLFQLYNDADKNMSFYKGVISFRNHNNEIFHEMKKIKMNEEKFRELQQWVRDIEWN